MFFDFSSDITTNISVTIRGSLVKVIDCIVEDQQKLQPEYKKRINRSSVMNILLAKILIDQQNSCKSIKKALTEYLEATNNAG